MIAYRLCQIDPHGQLAPIIIYGKLEGRIWKAKCKALELHKAPDEGCRCGLYSVPHMSFYIWGSLIEVQNPRHIVHSIGKLYPGGAVVEVECIGKTITHEATSDIIVEGKTITNDIVYRSEIQIPQVIYLPSLLAREKFSRKPLQDLLASVYDVDVVTVEEGQKIEL